MSQKGKTPTPPPKPDPNEVAKQQIHDIAEAAAVLLMSFIDYALGRDVEQRDLIENTHTFTDKIITFAEEDE